MKRIRDVDVERELEDMWRRAEELLDAGAKRRARNLFLAAAKRGHLASQNALGFLYSRQSGEKAKELALTWFRRAARRGDPCATNNIGTVYRDRGEPIRARRWFEKAVRMGLDDALLEIAKLYAGPLENFPRALETLDSILLRSRIVTECTKEEAVALRKRVRRLVSQAGKRSR